MPQNVHEELARLNRLISSLYEQGRYEQAIRYAIQARDLAQRRLGSEDLSYATTLNDLAELYRLTGNYAAAEPLLQQALQIRSRGLGEEHPHVAYILNNLGGLYFSMGNYDAAEPLYRRALKIIQTALDEDDPLYATSLNNLGNLYVKSGNYAAAEPFLQQSLAVRRRILGEQDPYVAQSLDNLAQAYVALGRYADAEDLYRRALEIYRLSVGEQHPSVAITINNLAELYRLKGEYAAAEPLYRQALAVYRATLGENHPFFLAARDNLASLHHLLAGDLSSEKGEQELLRLHQQASQLREQGRFAEAIPLAEQQLALLRQAGDAEHPHYATGLSNLGDLYRLAGNYAKAAPLLQQATEIFDRTLGQQHPYFVATQESLAALYQQMGDYVRAEPLYRQVLASKQRTLGEKHAEVASTLHNFALLHAQMGDYEGAVSLMQQSLEGYRATFGEEHPFVVATRDALANLLLMRGFSPPVQTANERIEAQLGQLSEQADQLREQGRFAEAIPLVEEQQELIRQLEGGEENLLFARTLSNLGLLHYAMGDYATAEPLLRQAQAITRRIGGEADPEYARELNNLALLLRAMGDYPAAVAMAQRALEIARTTLGEENPAVATAMNNLAGLYMAIGNYAAAEPLYRSALTIRRRRLGETHPQVAELLDNLGGLYFAIGDYGVAAEHAQQALDVYRRSLGDQHPDVATTLGNLAGLYRTIGDYTAALPLLEQALDIARAAFGEQHPAVARTLHMLAGLRRLMGHFTEAEALYLQALAMERALLGERHPRVAESLFNVAEFYRETGNFPAAEHWMREAVQIYEDPISQNHPYRAWMLYILALLCARRGGNDEALTYLLQAAAVEDRAIGQIFSIGSERQRLNYLALARTTYAFYLSVFVETLRSTPAAIQAALGFVLRRKALTLESSAVQRAAVLRGRYPDLAPKLRELTTLRLQIAQKVLSSSDISNSTGRDQLLADWYARQERLEAELASRIVEMRLEKQIESSSGQVVANALPAGAALVEFVHFDVYDFRAVPAQGEVAWKPAHYLAFVLLAGEPATVRMIDLGEAEPIDRLVTAFRIAATGGERALTKEPLPVAAVAGVATAAALRAAVFEPLLEALGGRTRLFLAPDGNLAQLPFEALPLDGGRWLLDAYQISYLSTGRDVLRFTATTPHAPQPPIVIADPDFDLAAQDTVHQPAGASVMDRQSRDLDRGQLRFTRLPGAKQEGEVIGAQLGVSPLLADAALEARIKGAHSPHILHLATHGFFLPDQAHDANADLSPLPMTALGRGGMGGRLFGQHLENPLLRSGLALAGANTWLQRRPLPPEAEDGLLTAEDVTSLDLLDTELVVLSACDTGLGDIRVGEGVFGLRRAFVLAGARTLVMSLWKVPDQATSELMVDFYRRILAGEPRAAALRQAQLTLKETHPDPYYWGAFVCQGAPGPLS